MKKWTIIEVKTAAKMHFLTHKNSWFIPNYVIKFGVCDMFDIGHTVAHS